jgi:hypothetical protein
MLRRLPLTVSPPYATDRDVFTNSNPNNRIVPDPSPFEVSAILGTAPRLGVCIRGTVKHPSLEARRDAREACGIQEV